jgi:hypothetical protein
MTGLEGGWPSIRAEGARDQKVNHQLGGFGGFFHHNLL